MRIGGNSIAAAYLGSTAISAAYLGSVQVFGGAPPLDIIFGGQSNALFHRDRVSSPPTPHPDTFMWDNVNGGWVAPTGNGLIQLCNDLQAGLGRPVRVVVWGQSATPIALFRKGAATFTLYADLIARITASGITPAYSLWHQGENDVAVGRDQAYYNAQLDGLHGELCADLGITRADMPWVVSSLGPATGTPTPTELAGGIQIQRALATINDFFPNIHYSHSNQDATLIDNIHWVAASYQESGKRYARTVLVLEGVETTGPAWYATSGERLTNTTTRIDLVHSMGTDFTPSTGITGWEVSNDNGVTYASASAARLDADSITLTHSDLGTGERLVRYQPSLWSDVTSPVKDNGALTSPLNYTPSPITVAGAASLPVLTYSATIGSSTADTTQTITGFPVPGSSGALLAVVGIAMQGVAPNSCTVTAQPSGVAVPATFVVASSGRPRLAIYQASLPSGTTSVDVTVTFAGSPFANAVVHVATMPQASLSSTTPVSSAANRLASASTITTNLATSAGGVVFVFSSLRIINSIPTTITGDEVYATRNVSSQHASTHLMGDTSNTAASASSAVTATFNGTGEVSIAAVSYR